MALKMVDERVHKYVPTSERDLPADQQTVICFRPMTKRAYDEYADSLFEVRKNKIINKSGQQAELLFKKVLAEDEKGVIIYNALLPTASAPSNITNRDLAVKFLMELPASVSTEIEQELRGFSQLDEDEEKNSGGQSGRA